MFAHAFKNLDPKKWIDRMHPQTLSIGVFLLYIDGFFAAVQVLDRTGELGLLRAAGGGYTLYILLAVSAYIGGGFLLANGKLLGWYIAVFASFTPFISRFFIYREVTVFSTRWIITGGDTIGFIFDAALCALLLHSMTRDYVKRWLR